MKNKSAHLKIKSLRRWAVSVIAAIICALAVSTVHNVYAADEGIEGVTYTVHYMGTEKAAGAEHISYRAEGTLTYTDSNSGYALIGYINNRGSISFLWVNASGDYSSSAPKGITILSVDGNYLNMSWDEPVYYNDFDDFVQGGNYCGLGVSTSTSGYSYERTYTGNIPIYLYNPNDGRTYQEFLKSCYNGETSTEIGERYWKDATEDYTYTHMLPTPIIEKAKIYYNDSENPNNLGTGKEYVIIFDWNHDMTDIPVEDAPGILEGMQTEIWLRCEISQIGKVFTRLSCVNYNVYFDIEKNCFTARFTLEEVANILYKTSGVNPENFRGDFVGGSMPLRLYLRNVKTNGETKYQSSGYSFFQVSSDMLVKDITTNRNDSEVLDKDGINDSNSLIHHQGNEHSSSDYQYGDWSSMDLKEFIDNGFGGLAGENGIIALIGNVFTFIPKEIITLFVMFIGIAVVIALVKLVF